MKKKTTALLVLLLLAGVALFFFFSHQLVTWLWFRSLGALSQFWVPLLTKLGIRFGLGVFCFGFLLLNLRQTKKAFLELQTEVKFSSQQHLFLSTLTALVLTFFLLPGAAPDWTVVQQYLHRTDFGVTDPIFQLDLGFYFFAYPFYQRLIVTFLGLTILTLLGVTLFYVIAQAYWYQDKKFQFWPRARIHLTLLGVLFFLLKGGRLFPQPVWFAFRGKSPLDRRGLYHPPYPDPRIQPHGADRGPDRPVPPVDAFQRKAPAFAHRQSRVVVMLLTPFYAGPSPTGRNGNGQTQPVYYGRALFRTPYPVYAVRLWPGPD